MKRIISLSFTCLLLIAANAESNSQSDGLPDLFPAALDDEGNRMSTNYVETSSARIIYDVASIYDYELVTHPSLASKGQMNLILRDVTPKEVLDIVTDVCDFTWESDGKRITVMPRNLDIEDRL